MQSLEQSWWWDTEPTGESGKCRHWKPHPSGSPISEVIFCRAGRASASFFPSTALPFDPSEPLFLIMLFVAKGEIFWFLIKMFTQKTCQVLNPRECQVHLSPHGCGCLGDGRKHNCYSYTQPWPGLPPTGLLESSPCGTNRKQTLGGDWVERRGGACLPL